MVTKIFVRVELMRFDHFGGETPTLQDLILALVKTSFVGRHRLLGDLFDLDHLGRFTLDHQGRLGDVDRRHPKCQYNACRDGNEKTGDDFPPVLAHDLPVIAQIRSVSACSRFTPDRH